MTSLSKVIEGGWIHPPSPRDTWDPKSPGLIGLTWIHVGYFICWNWNEQFVIDLISCCMHFWKSFVYFLNFSFWTKPMRSFFKICHVLYRWWCVCGLRLFYNIINTISIQYHWFFELRIFAISIGYEDVYKLNHYLNWFGVFVRRLLTFKNIWNPGSPSRFHSIYHILKKLQNCKIAYYLRNYFVCVWLFFSPAKKIASVLKRKNRQQSWMNDFFLLNK